MPSGLITFNCTFVLGIIAVVDCQAASRVWRQLQTLQLRQSTVSFNVAVTLSLSVTAWRYTDYYFLCGTYRLAKTKLADWIYVLCVVCTLQYPAFNPLKPSIVMRLHFEWSAPYRHKLPFLISDIQALWRSALSARVPECQKLKMVAYACMANCNKLRSSWALKG